MYCYTVWKHARLGHETYFSPEIEMAAQSPTKQIEQPNVNLLQ